MKNLNFENAAWEAFQEAATEKYDFATCQRSDGSKYGTGGQCRKGTPTTPGSDDDKKKSSSKSGGGGGSVKDLQKTAKDLDKKAKAADKAANKADSDWRKGGAKTGTEEHKRVKQLDKEAKAANKAADKADKEYQKAAKAAGGKMSDGEKKELQIKASKGDKAAMKALNDARAAGKIGKEPGFEPKGDGGKARKEAKASGEVADRKAAARKENEAKKVSQARTDSKMSSADAARVKAQFDRKRQMERGGQDGPKATAKQKASARKNFQSVVNNLENKLESGAKLTQAEQAQLNLARAAVKANS